MARKHTIFIGALFHVAIAMLKSAQRSVAWFQPVAWSAFPLPPAQPGLGSSCPEICEAGDPKTSQLMAQSAPQILLGRTCRLPPR